jgi:hypothetical protein
LGFDHSNSYRFGSFVTVENSGCECKALHPNSDHVIVEANARTGAVRLGNDATFEVRVEVVDANDALAGGNILVCVDEVAYCCDPDLGVSELIDPLHKRSGPFWKPCLVVLTVAGCQTTNSQESGV